MDLTESINNQADVVLRITKHLLQTQGKDKNMVFSPLSIHIALSLITAGSKGSTKAELLSFLKSNSSEQLNALASYLLLRIFYSTHEYPLESPIWGMTTPRLSFANSLLVVKSTPVKPSFKRTVDFAYKAAINEVDFKTKADQARIEVNLWAKKETNGLMEEVLPCESIDRETRILFANALYFKGDWEDKFSPDKTTEYEFFLLNGESLVKVPFMTGMRRRFVSVFDGFRVLKIPYKMGSLVQTRSFCMYLLLPDAKDGLPSLVERACSESGFLDRHLPKEEVIVGDFRIPKFKFSSGFDACEILKDLGLVSPFVVDLGGGKLREMIHSPSGEDPYVSNIHHKSVIEFNEHGTIATVVYLIRLKGDGRDVHVPPFVDQFVADHPFMFLIREKITGTVLFISHVLNPLEG